MHKYYMECVATKTMWPQLGGGGGPYQALPLCRFLAYKIHVHEKVRKGEGEPGDEAIFGWYSIDGCQSTCCIAI